jgi:hypothetical protein
VPYNGVSTGYAGGYENGDDIGVWLLLAKDILLIATSAVSFEQQLLGVCFRWWSSYSTLMPFFWPQHDGLFEFGGEMTRASGTGSNGLYMALTPSPFVIA